MRASFVFAVVGSLAVASSGVVSQAGFSKPAAAGQCLDLGRINGYNPVAGNRILVEGDGKAYYEFTTTETCPNLNSTFRLVLQSRTRDSTVCAGSDVDLLVRDSSGARSQCVVKLVRQVSNEEARILIKPKG